MKLEDALEDTMPRLDGFFDPLEGHTDLGIEMGVDPEFEAFELGQEVGELIHVTPFGEKWRDCFRRVFKRVLNVPAFVKIITRYWGSSLLSKPPVSFLEAQV